VLNPMSTPVLTLVLSSMFAFIHSQLLYGIEVCGNTSKNNINKLIILNNKILRIVQGGQLVGLMPVLAACHLVFVSSVVCIVLCWWRIKFSLSLCHSVSQLINQSSNQKLGIAHPRRATPVWQ